MAIILKGDAAQGIELVFDTLMVRANDEPDAVYGLVAETADVADDGMSVTFKLRPEAKFADGSPVTADDVVFSFDILKQKGHPRITVTIRDVSKAEALDSSTVRYTFQGQLVRDLPLTVAGLPIFSKAFYATREFDQTTLEPPLGSGPYKIGGHKAGTYVSYVRRDDYWAKDLPVNRGLYNFDEVRYEYYRDRGLELENLLSGNFDFREEFTSKDWATGYDKPVVKSGKVVLQTLPDERPSGAQGFFINMRREKFKDIRVRQALDLAFDFEWSNRNLFFGLYKRTASFFENSDMKAAGPPSPEELALLEPYRDKLPPEVFGEPYSSPVTDGSGNNRDQLRKAAALLAEAGWKQTPEGLKNAAGEKFTIEILLFEESFERIIGPYIKNLRLIGSRCQHAARGPVPVRAARQGFRLRDDDGALCVASHAGNRAQGVLGLGSGQDDGQLQSGRHCRSCARPSDREGDHGQVARRARGCNAGLRPRPQSRPLLGAAVVQGRSQSCVLEQVRLAGHQSPNTSAARSTRGGTTRKRMQN